jgi:hypothetical protein
MTSSFSFFCETSFSTLFRFDLMPKSSASVVGDRFTAVRGLLESDCALEQDDDGREAPRGRSV